MCQTLHSNQPFAYDKLYAISAEMSNENDEIKFRTLTVKFKNITATILHSYKRRIHVGSQSLGRNYVDNLTFPK